MQETSRLAPNLSISGYPFWMAGCDAVLHCFGNCAFPLENYLMLPVPPYQIVRMAPQNEGSLCSKSDSQWKALSQER